jgi:hypothetical protein
VRWPPRQVGGHAQARQRLRATEFRVDEVAFDVGRQHAGPAVRLRLAHTSHLAEKPIEDIGRARDRRRTERRDAPAREPLGHRRDRRFVIEHIRPRDAVDVDVDEAGNDEVAVEVDPDLARSGLARTADEVDDPVVLEHERLARHHAVRQHEAGAGQETASRFGAGHQPADGVIRRTRPA